MLAQRSPCATINRHRRAPASKSRLLTSQRLQNSRDGIWTFFKRAPGPHRGIWAKRRHASVIVRPGTEWFIGEKSTQF